MEYKKNRGQTSFLDEIIVDNFAGGGGASTGMERLTERHYKKSDGHYMKCSEYCEKEDLRCDECKEFDELVDRLGAIEDILGDDYDLDRLRELVEADREGRVRFVSKVSGDVCGTCKHFGRFSGRKMGACRVKKFAQDRRGREDRSREFVTSQSRRACKKYEPREE